MDDDLEGLTHAELSAEVKKLRAGIRAHRNGDSFALTGLSLRIDRLLDPADLLWPGFCGGCLPAPPRASSAQDHSTPRPIVSLHYRRRA